MVLSNQSKFQYSLSLLIHARFKRHSAFHLAFFSQDKMYDSIIFTVIAIKENLLHLIAQNVESNVGFTPLHL